MRTGEIVIAGLLVSLGGGIGWLVLQQTTTQQIITARLDNLTNKVENTSRSLDKTEAKIKAATTQMAILVETLKKPRPPSAENINDAVVAAVMLSRLSSARVRAAAAVLLSRLPRRDDKDTRAEDRLQQLVEKETDNTVRRAAMDALRTLHSKRLVPTLMQIIKTGDPAAKADAARVLATNPTTETLPALLAAMQLLREKNPGARNARTQIYYALKRLGDTRACKPLVQALRFEQSYARNPVALALVECATRRELPELLAALKVLSTEDQNRGTIPSAEPIFRAIAKLGDIRASKALLPYLQVKNWQWQMIALMGLLKLRDPLVAPDLKVAYDKLNKSAKTNYYLRRVEKILRAGVPGLIFDAKKKSLTLVDQETLKKLLVERAKRLKRDIAAAKNAPLANPDQDVF